MPEVLSNLVALKLQAQMYDVSLKKNPPNPPPPQKKLKADE